MVVEYGGPIACGGVVVQEGDLVVGDSDGLVVVPRAVEAEVIRRALEKVEGENRTRAALEQGLTLTEVYAKYGVL
jgi:regulator of RNase E activity RraA